MPIQTDGIVYDPPSNTFPNITITTGQFLTQDGTVSIPAWAFNLEVGNGFYRPGAGSIAWVNSNTVRITFFSQGIVGYAPDFSIQFGGDTLIIREAANVLAQHGFLNAQTFNIYSAFTAVGNYKGRLALKAAAGVMTLQAESAGATADANIDIALTPKGTGNVNITVGVLEKAGLQVVGARVVNAGIGSAIEAAFTALYPNASAVLAALQAGIQAHGLITAA